MDEQVGLLLFDACKGINLAGQSSPWQATCAAAAAFSKAATAKCDEEDQSEAISGCCDQQLQRRERRRRVCSRLHVYPEGPRYSAASLCKGEVLQAVLSNLDPAAAGAEAPRFGRPFGGPGGREDALIGVLRWTMQASILFLLAAVICCIGAFTAPVEDGLSPAYGSQGAGAASSSLSSVVGGRTGSPAWKQLRGNLRVVFGSALKVTHPVRSALLCSI
eukprot:TRINITY_DN55664_c0_g1_i2.p1 TRINITY_DN55664_c0_g1~~TRINITY_DN55664_c0_g1_i2.p1  ORF type:complete len:242 (+),score=29.00 TRINITY_DN55664_c0_g1_i2:71-727(+)